MPREPRLGFTFITAPQRVYSASQYIILQFECTGLETAAKHCKASIKNLLATDLLWLYDIFITRCIRKAQSLIKGTSHPAHTLVSLLPSGKRYWSIKSRTTHFRFRFFPQVVRIMNSTHTHYADTQTLNL